MHIIQTFARKATVVTNEQELLFVVQEDV